jgi:5-methylcytosine-specific restriction endonuclease McrA
MIHVRFRPDELDDKLRSEFERWRALAESATKAVLEQHAAGKKVTFRKHVYAGLREWLFLNVFNGKCAYCEGDVRSVAYGHAEHWRPKSEVRERNADGKDVLVRDSSRDPHPGYFWVAYDWRNLVPACEECNVGTKARPGKRTVFPVNRKRVFSPAECLDFDRMNEIEDPLLLHPFDEERDPKHHIEFDEYGQPVARDGSDYGRHSIQVFNLDRHWLNSRRQPLYDEMRQAVKNAIVQEMSGGQKAVETLREQMRGSKPFAGAIRYYIRYWWPIVTRFEEAP